MKRKPAKPAKPPRDLTPDDKEEVRRESRFSEIGKTEGKDKKSRLRGLFSKWRSPIDFPLKKSEENELLDYKIILPMAAVTVAGPAICDVDVCDSQEELAKRLMLHFQNPDKTSKLRIEITKKTISDWSKGKRLSGNIPPFPKIEGTRKYRYSLRAAIDWFNSYLWHDYRADANQKNGSVASSFVPLGELREVAERAELEKTLFDIQVAKGGYIATQKAESILGGAMRQYHDFLKGLMENVSPEKLESFCLGIGLTPAQTSAVKDYQIKENRWIIDELESESDRRSRDNSDHIEVQVKHDLGNG